MPSERSRYVNSSRSGPQVWESIAYVGMSLPTYSVRLKLPFPSACKRRMLNNLAMSQMIEEQGRRTNSCKYAMKQEAEGSVFVVERSHIVRLRAVLAHVMSDGATPIAMIGFTFTQPHHSRMRPRKSRRPALPTFLIISSAGQTCELFMIWFILRGRNWPSDL